MISRVVILGLLLGVATAHRHLHHVTYKHHSKAKSAFTPVFTFSESQKHGGKVAAVNMVGAPLPTRFEFQRACYGFIYKTLQDASGSKEHPEEAKDVLMSHCAPGAEKTECEDQAQKFVKILEKKEETEKHSKHHFERQLSSEHRSNGHKKETYEADGTRKKEHKETSKKHIRGGAQEEKKKEKKVEENDDEVDESKKPVGGKVFAPKSRGSVHEEELGTGEAWSPPKAHHHTPKKVSFLQEEPMRYDEWCDQLYVKSGGAVEAKQARPSASDAVPKN